MDDLSVTARSGQVGAFLLDTRTAYRHKSNAELKGALRIFRLMKYPGLVKLGSRLAVWALEAGLPVKGLIRDTLYKHFCGGESLQEALHCIREMGRSDVSAVLDYAAEGQDSEESFDQVRDTIISNIELAAYNSDIKFVSVKVTGLASHGLLEKATATTPLSNEEKEALTRVWNRLDAICFAAFKHDVVVYIDAEETWIQDPIDEMTLEMMRKYNKKKAIVFNTFQMYRRDGIALIRKTIELSTSQGFIAGIKIVRGAYWEKETKRALGMGYPTPVFFRKEDTDSDFNAAIFLCLGNPARPELCIATHNEKSTSLALEILESKPVEKRPAVQFSQLFGMCDHLTYNLAQRGYIASKYLPYGKVEIAMPYLLRRAEENTSVGKQVNRDLLLLEKELRRRKKEGE